MLHSDVWRNELSVAFQSQMRVINMATHLFICYLNMKAEATDLAMHVKNVMNCIIAWVKV